MQCVVDEFGSVGILVEVLGHPQRHQSIDQHAAGKEVAGLLGVGAGEGPNQAVNVNHAASHGRPECRVGGGHEAVEENEQQVLVAGQLQICTTQRGQPVGHFGVWWHRLGGCPERSPGSGTRHAGRWRGTTGITLPLAAFTGHLLNETVVHGYDIARAAKRPWQINPTHAVLVMDRFFLPLIQGADLRKLVNADTAAGVHATFDVRIRGASRFRFYFVFDNGALRVETPSARRIDCHLSADAAAFLLVFWNRQSQWQAIAKGQLMAWGRSPWLAPRFRSLLVTP